MKRGIELDTRRFRTFYPSQIRNTFSEQGFVVRAEQAQFLWPMVLHRLTNHALISKAAEAPGRLLGLTSKLGSPVIVRADRQSRV